MRYEFEKLRVMLVSGEMRERERFFFLQSGMHLSAETVGFCRYGQYFFQYETKGVFVPVYWSVRYIPAVVAGTVRN